MELISRADAIKDAESWVAVDEHERRLQKNVIEWLKEFPPAEPGTNLAEVGTRAVRGYPIDADALMEKVAEEYGERARDTLYRIIRYMPPARPEPKRGKWIEDKGQQTLMKNFIERGEVWRVCSVCGAGYMIGHKYASDKAYHDTHHNFCPNCGCKMEVTE